VTSPIRPERRVLLELIEQLEQIQSLADAGDRELFVADDHYRWVIERLWIAVGNEAEAYLRLASPAQQEPWRSLRRLRNELAHVRLADIDQDEVWRVTVLRPLSLIERARSLLL
jgi:uncharacterized protein with HEPN domain